MQRGERRKRENGEEINRRIDFEKKHHVHLFSSDRI